MTFSLADCILNSNDPERQRRPARTGPREPRKEGGARERKPSPPPPPPLEPVPGIGAEEISQIRQLIGEATKEWREVSRDIGELKKALDGAGTFEAPRQRSAPEATVAPAPSPPPPAPAAPILKDRPAPRPPPAVEKPPAAAGAPVGALTRGPTRAPPRPPPKLMTQPPRPERPPAEPPRESAEINARLGELLRLLKESLVNKASTAPTAIEIPKSLTLEIAREVAGRVKDSVLSTLQTTPSKELAPKAPATQPVSEKKIPFDDIGALIDQLTGQGRQ